MGWPTMGQGTFLGSDLIVCGGRQTKAGGSFQAHLGDPVPQRETEKAHSVY